MNKKPIAVVLLTALCFSVTQNVSVAIETNTEPFLVDIVLSRNQVFPYEPVAVLLRLKNVTTVDQILRSTFGALLLFGTQEKGPWQGYGTPAPQPASIPPWQATFRPGETMNTVQYIDITFDNDHAFSTPGTYWIKGRFADRESNPIKVEVIQPTSTDVGAIEVLRKNRIYKYFSQSSVQILLEQMGEADPSPEITAFIAQYPSSRYAQWAKLALLLIKRQQAVSMAVLKDDVTGLRAIQKELAQLGPSLLPSISAECWFAAGVTSVMCGDATLAQNAFSKAAATGGSAIMSEQVALSLKGLSVSNPSAAGSGP